MNKKIHYNSRYILLSEAPVQPAENQLIVDSEAVQHEELKAHLNNFIQQSATLNLILLGKNVNSIFESIKQHFVVIVAAGGLIQRDNKFLFIFRLKKWDLPKGKLDAGETPEIAAIRECEEECAIKELKITSKLTETYHLYPYKGQFALKISHWFAMESTFTGVLVPQTEENIEKVEWMTKEQIETVVKVNTYPTILEVISLGIK